MVYDETNSCIKAQANFYGEEVTTNNKAEIKALEDLMRWLEEAAP